MSLNKSKQISYTVNILDITGLELNINIEDFGLYFNQTQPYHRLEADFLYEGSKIDGQLILAENILHDLLEGCIIKITRVIVGNMYIELLDEQQIKEMRKKIFEVERLIEYDLDEETGKNEEIDENEEIFTFFLQSTPVISIDAEN